jgi:hypothetical protein
MLRTSLGHHTFNAFCPLRQEGAKEAWEIFDTYRDKNPDLVMESLNSKPKLMADGSLRMLCPGYVFRFKGIDCGIKWKLWFNDTNSNFKYYGIETIINPKILSGEKDYITAANEDHFRKVEIAHDELTKQISPRLPTFDMYSLKRMDYCVNFDLPELGYNCSPELFLELIKRSDIPPHYFIPTKYDKKQHRHISSYDDCYYLKSGSVIINCYLKEAEWRKKYPDRPGIEQAKYVIRFEVQFFPRQTYRIKKNLKESLHSYQYRECDIAEMLLSDCVCEDTILRYFKRVIKYGDYYTLTEARKKIQSHDFCQSKKTRLISVLEFINQKRGIAKARDSYGDDKCAKAEFNRALRELSEIEINPVTIPREWGIPFIPGLLKRYFEINNRNINDVIPLKLDSVNHNLEKRIDYMKII